MGRNLSKMGRNLSKMGRNLSKMGRNLSKMGRNLSKMGRNLSKMGRNLLKMGRNLFGTKSVKIQRGTKSVWDEICHIPCSYWATVHRWSLHLVRIYTVMILLFNSNRVNSDIAPAMYVITPSKRCNINGCCSHVTSSRDRDYVKTCWCEPASH